MRVARNLAVRFYAEDERVGIDPDLCVLAPPPPELDDIGSVCLWKPGHTAPTLCIEERAPLRQVADGSARRRRQACQGVLGVFLYRYNGE